MKNENELTAALATIEKCREIVGCPAGVDLQDHLQQLATENLTMLRLLTDISENHVEYLSEGEGYMFAGVPLDYVSEINMYVSRDVNAENPFPATDRIYAGIKADGVEEFAAYCGDENSVFVEAKAYYRSLPDAAYEFCVMLREETGK
ncbi:MULTISPECIES: hypothetical protein [Klebsiella/Raoultella group]|uniref:hypothetical protein n=1 Tax=Klebsiella/Raoultella group TaxID=2890311 RepID=UPI000D9F085D|nr:MULTISPECIES: hypothetical protein [Klebsiella/Raoultella group]MBL0787747.1 hypothetical protein [Klebsiella michiganensis]MCE9803327.1 hypothetical protein [Raoultella ornithinolytica]MCE9813706.1 hypothetical protein [Raoultella ornithinolytica]MCE9869385.1 hypothetical protein [Raoultella ornithinolytica]SPZ25291.1 Uncharacterised protein [Raoultella planticola]